MAIDLSKVEKLYSNNIKEFGIDAKSVGWGTKEKQDLRFTKLMSVVQEKNDPFTINELGCGYGELVKFCEMNNFDFVKYDGYDVSQDMIDAANKYIGGEKVTLYKSANIETQADYTIASGIFNVMFDEQKDNWENYIKETISHMFEKSNKGISFNFLTKYVDWEQENLYYADPLLYFDYCKNNLSKKVNLIHDYELYEFTLQLVK